MKIVSYSATGQKGNVEVSSELFAAQSNPQLLAQAVRVYLTNLRQKSSLVQTRSEVSRTKKKWFRQKGTGNARHGARTAHIFVGGGVVHGPNADQNWHRKLSKKQKGRALTQALSAQAAQTAVVNLSSIQGKTNQAVQLLNKIQAQGKILLVVSDFTPEIKRSFSNLSQVLLTKASRLNALEVVSADQVLIENQALTVLSERITLADQEKQTSAPAVAKKVTKKVAEVASTAATKSSQPKKAVSTTKTAKTVKSKSGKTKS